MGRRTLLINLVLLGAVALSASYLVSSWKQFESENSLRERVMVRAPSALTASLDDRETRSPLGEFAVIGEKPLFRPDRTPVGADPDAAASVEAPDPPNAEMTGSSLFGGVARATLKISPDRRNGAVQTLTVSPGDSPPQLNGYRVAEVTPVSVTLQWNDRQHFLELTAAAPERPAQAADAKSGVTIINVGQSAPAVASTVVESVEADQRGLEVATIQGAAANARGLGARGGARGGLNQGRSGASTAGTGARPPTRRPTTQNRPNNN